MNDRIKTDRTTIVLLTDGRYVKIGPGDDHELPDSMAGQMRMVGLRGWLAIMRGNPWSRNPVDLYRVHAVGDARDDEWDAAVDQLRLVRSRT